MSGFYGRHVQLPSSNAPVPTEILTNPKWFPWFKPVLGAIDGTHLPCFAPAAELHTARKLSSHLENGPKIQCCIILENLENYLKLVEFLSYLKLSENRRSPLWIIENYRKIFNVCGNVATLYPQCT